MAKKFLSVYPNPFIALDHDGFPAGACPCDMPEHVGMTTRRWVGAELDRDATFLLEKLSEEELKYRNARQQTRFKFSFAEPTKLPITEYYKDRIRHGELFAADKPTARLADVADKDFEEPLALLAKSKAEAAKKWIALHGPDEIPEGIDSLDKAIASLDKAIASLGKGEPPVEAPKAEAPKAPDPSKAPETPKPTKEVKSS